MDVHKSSLLDVFDTKQRLEVPLFQRQYVWNEEHQWLPLWEDIERKFSETLAGRKDGPVHFLGAMVLDQKQTPTGHVVRRQIIDGQQRLTTLQIFLSAFRDFCREHDCNELADECAKFTQNTGMMSDPQIDKFKVWPTQLDRSQFADVITAGSKSALLAMHPLVRKKYAQKYDPRPRMVEAYLFFYLQMEVFFLGENDEKPAATDFPLATRLEECFGTLKNALMVVIIDLQASDDPQVIFETLNARGEPLLPADLLRNYIFLRASRDGGDAEALYKKYWQGFDDEFWRQEVKQGRLTRPRSDLFMQHFLASMQGQDIPIKHLYVEYRHWVERVRPFANVEEELATLARHRDHFRRILEPRPGDPLFDLAMFMDAYDIRTGYPFLLALLDAEVSGAAWLEISRILQSYLLRRAVCAFTTKNYNRIFLALTRNLRRDGFTPENVRTQLQGQIGESGSWPDDTTFKAAWLDAPMYSRLGNSRLVFLLSRLNDTFSSTKAEALTFSSQPSIEHILPQSWREHWPLADGSSGLSWQELYEAEDGDDRALMTRARNAKLQTVGNLTILSTGLNSAQSNLGWGEKRPELMKHSLLPLNQALQGLAAWNEASIEARGRLLFDRALSLWPK